jgi:hypothetical protein
MGSMRVGSCVPQGLRSSGYHMRSSRSLHRAPHWRVRSQPALCCCRCPAADSATEDNNKCMSSHDSASIHTLELN